MPDAAQQAWHWFLQLNSSRQSSGFGPNPLSNAEIRAFFQLEGAWPQAWELTLIRAFDRLVMQAAGEQMKKDSDKAKRRGA